MYIGFLCLLSLVSAYPEFKPVVHHLQEQKIWTLEEMQNAIPRGPLMRTNSSSDEYELACPGNFALYSNCNDPIYRGNAAVGKVFFTMGGSNYVCSASMGANNLVWTAGHCLYDRADGFASTFTFAINYCNGGGTQFTAATLFTNTRWQQGDFSYDYSIAKFNGSPFSGRRQLPVRIVSNPLTTTYLSQGYPAGAPFRGAYVNECNAIGCERDPNSGNPRTIAIACDSTGGSSGGPWVTNNGIGSVNSYGYTGVKDTMYGPFF